MRVSVGEASVWVGGIAGTRASRQMLAISLEVNPISCDAVSN